MKLKSIKWRSVAVFCGWIIFSCGMIMLLGFVNKYQESIPCDAVQVKIDDKVPHDFIDREDILNLINSNSIIGKPIGSINISLLEKKLMSNPYVNKAEVYSSVDGKLQVNVLQRDPLVRIINSDNEQFYIDRNGKFMPVSDHYSTPVITANGYIFEPFSMMQVPEWDSVTVSDSVALRPKQIITEIFELAKYLDADTFWNALAEQIYINELLEIEMIPRIGNHRIILGTTDNLEEKLNRLYIFYTRGLQNTGWNNYSVIDLKYKNQVVCTKIKD
jgi:cell division protein FtsQ